MQNRQKGEMIRDILASANGGAAISKIMFRAYITHGQAKGYLGELIANGLVEYDVLVRQYRTTPKGIEYLKAAESMSEMLFVSTMRTVVKKESPFV